MSYLVNVLPLWFYFLFTIPLLGIFWFSDIFTQMACKDYDNPEEKPPIWRDLKDNPRTYRCYCGDKNCKKELKTV